MKLLEHLPALQVVLPLLCGPLIVLIRRQRAAWLLASAVSWACLAIAVALAAQVLETGPISYAIGSWPPPLGIEYRIDALSAFVLVLVSLTGAVVMPYARVSIAAELPREQEYLFFAMYCLCLTGLLGIAITGDVFNLFVFLEISSLSSYVLIALGQRRRALVAAYQYLIMGTIGATFYVIGVGLLYLMTGTLNLADLAARLPALTDVRPIIAALAFITVGVGLKLALFPLHQWLPNAYAFAPSVVTAFLAATATKVSVYVLLRFYYIVFDEALVFQRLLFDEVLIALSAFAMVAMSLVAVFQPDLKRMFAYSSVAQIGFIILGASLANTAGLTGAIAHLFNHGITKGALFLLLGCIALRCGGTAFSQIAGLGRRMPLTTLGIVVAGLSLIGIPATAGFSTKWYLALGALDRGAWWLVVVIVGSSMISIAYVWRFVEAAYLQPAGDQAPRAGEPPLSMLIPAWLMVLGCVYFGLDTRFNVGYARHVADLLLQISQ